MPLLIQCYCFYVDAGIRRGKWIVRRSLAVSSITTSARESRQVLILFDMPGVNFTTQPMSCASLGHSYSSYLLSGRTIDVNVELCHQCQAKISQALVACKRAWGRQEMYTDSSQSTYSAGYLAARRTYMDARAANANMRIMLAAQREGKVGTSRSKVTKLRGRNGAGRRRVLFSALYAAGKKRENESLAPSTKTTAARPNAAQDAILRKCQVPGAFPSDMELFTSALKPALKATSPQTLRQVTTVHGVAPRCIGEVKMSKNR